MPGPRDWGEHEGNQSGADRDGRGDRRTVREHWHLSRRSDNELSLVDGKDRTLTIQQWDTFLNGVFPLDRNRLTREWFQSGRAKYNVSGAGADEFEGTLELGYQIGFPWSLGVGINFSYTTPNILIDQFSPT